MERKEKKGIRHTLLWKLRWGILLILECALIFSMVKITKYKRETTASRKANEELAEAVTVVTPPTEAAEREPGAEEEPEDGTEAVTVSQSSDTCPITVDFKLLLEKNRDCVAWIYCEDTPINLGVMQADDNIYYLNRTFDRVDNGYGTIFLDCNSSPGFKDANNLIFGHDMQNGTMFGSLEKYHDQEYYEKHRCLWLVTEYRTYRLDVVAGLIHTDSSPLYSTPISRSVTDELVPQAIRESIFHSDAEYNPEARYVTLSTCSDDFGGARLALICEMVEIK